MLYIFFGDRQNNQTVNCLYLYIWELHDSLVFYFYKILYWLGEIMVSKIWFAETIR